MPRYVRACLLDELPQNQIEARKIDGMELILIRRGDSVFSLKDQCPHAGSPLSTGYIKGSNIMCAYHAAKFDIETGASQGPPAMCDVPCYATRVEEGWVEVLLPE